MIARGRKDLIVVKASSLQEVWNILLGVSPPRKVKCNLKRVKVKEILRHSRDLSAIRGIARAKQAMIVALAGGHNILLVGPTGEGKSMLAEAATGLLPAPGRDEQYEVNKVYSAKGELKADEIILQRPFQEVGQKVTEAGLFGGGHAPHLFPGIISLAHRGVLLLDEVNLFDGKLIEKLRRPLDYGRHKIQHSHGTVEYPCNFILVATMNPCKDGMYLHYRCPKCHYTTITAEGKCPKHPREKLQSLCSCTQKEISSYRDKLSKPLLNRIDLKVLVSPHDEQPAEEHRNRSSTVKRRIEAAREVQQRRYKGEDLCNCNAKVSDLSHLQRCTRPLREDVKRLLSEIFRKDRLSQRMRLKVHLVSRTIADLEERRDIGLQDVGEAVNLMGLDHPYFRHFGL